MIYAASDIHGRWEKYCALLERLSHEDPDYTLYLLGDSIDRNKGGCRILLDAMNRPNVISLLGNHEFSAAVCLPWLLQEVTEENLSAVDQERITSVQEWIFNGGAPTLEELRELSRQEKAAILDYIRDMDVYAEVETGGRSFLLTHAGLDHFQPEKDLEEYDLTDFLFGRSFAEQQFYQGEYLVFGHTPTREIHRQLGQPPADDVIFGENKIAIDCACGYDGGRLGCLNLNTLAVFYL